MWCKEDGVLAGSSSTGIDKTSEKTYNYSSEEYQKMLQNKTTYSINDDIHKLPHKGAPNTIQDLLFTDNTVKQRRIIGEEGVAVIDIDTTDHNQPWKHTFGAHKHYWENGKKESDVLDFTDKELKDNSDIIKKGVNYHKKG